MSTTNKPQSISQPTVAIITVTYNSEHFINDYLQAVDVFLKNSTHQLILVDNLSTDDTVSLLKNFASQSINSDRIQVAALDTNLGFGKGCNHGAELAKTLGVEVLWFLNPDTRIFDDSGKALLALLGQEPKTDFVGSVLVDKNNSPRPGAFRFPKLLNIVLSNLRLGVLDKLFAGSTTAIPVDDKPYEADWLTGASFMVRAERFFQLKGFDPFYFLYFEEVDLFYRAKQLGMIVKACPASKVFHISGASTGINTKNQAPKRRPDYWFESRRHFYISNFGKVYFAVADCLFLVSHGLWLLRATLQGKDTGTPPKLAADIFRHSILGKFCGSKK